MLVYQMHAQPQKNVNSQKASTSYTKKCLYVNIPYRVQPYHKHNKYLCVQLDTSADVNLMPESVYKLIFNDPHTSKLARNGIDLTAYTGHSAYLISKCTFYMLSKDTKQPVKVDFYITKDEGNTPIMWDSVPVTTPGCKTKTWILSTKSNSYLKCGRLSQERGTCTIRIHKQQQGTEVAHSGYTVANSGPMIAKSKPIMQWEDTAKKIKIFKTKEQIKEQYPELFKGIGRFPGEPYHIHTDPSITPKQTTCRPIPVHLKETFRQEINKMLKAGVIKMFMKQLQRTGKTKLCICLDPTDLNKAIIHGPYCFCTPEDIAHKLSGATFITVSDCSKGYWHQPIDEESSFLTTFNNEII